MQRENDIPHIVEEFRNLAQNKRLRFFVSSSFSKSSSSKKKRRFCTSSKSCFCTMMTKRTRWCRKRSVCRNLARKTHVVVDLKHHIALRMRRLQKTEKRKKRSFTYLGIPSIARSTPAMMRERKRQRALLRLRLRDVAARDDAEFFCCFLFCCFRESEQRGGRELMKIFL